MKSFVVTLFIKNILPKFSAESYLIASIYMQKVLHKQDNPLAKDKTDIENM